MLRLGVFVWEISPPATVIRDCLRLHAHFSTALSTKAPRQKKRCESTPTPTPGAAASILQISLPVSRSLVFQKTPPNIAFLLHPSLPVSSFPSGLKPSGWFQPPLKGSRNECESSREKNTQTYSTSRPAELG